MTEERPDFSKLATTLLTDYSGIQIRYDGEMSATRQEPMYTVSNGLSYAIRPEYDPLISLWKSSILVITQQLIKASQQQEVSHGSGGLEGGQAP